MLLRISGFFKQLTAEILGSQRLQEEGQREVMADRLADHDIPPVDRQSEEIVHIERAPEAKTDL
jgi:hypothetical protein